MLIKRQSILSGKVHEMDVNVTEDQFNLWQSGVLIQNAMPHLSADEREFMISGITVEEWKTLHGENEA